jgi:hypothetical protein
MFGGACERYRPRGIVNIHLGPCFATALRRPL